MSRRAAQWSVFAVLCLLTVVVYVPGLGSGFLVDDFYNLHQLERVATDGYAAYVFTGVAGPSGRPLSLLSFALQHRSWPDAPLHFKAVNLLLHLCCGLLVFLVLRRLERVFGLPPRVAAAAVVVCTGLWLLHPIQLSTVLYVVQRMAQLSTLFMLAGLYGWLAGREACVRGELRRGYLLMSFSIVLGTLCAVLSKENGVLLPLLVLVVDATLLHSFPRPPRYGHWRALFLLLPILIIAAYFIWQLPATMRGFAGLSYDMPQKLATEAVVLVQYLLHLLLPNPGAFGLYHDDFPISRGLLDPPRTLGAVIAISAAVAAAIHWRRRWPLPAFAALWFFGGHLLESSHLNLALYFEHRNYLPALGPLLLLAAGAALLVERASTPRLFAAILGVYALFVVSATAQNSLLWSRPMLQGYDAAWNHPDSHWALNTLGNGHLTAGDIGMAMAVFQQMEEKFPRSAYPRLKQAVVVACVQGRAMDRDWWRRTHAEARRAQADTETVLAELGTVVWALGEGDCSALDTEQLLRFIRTLANNPNFRRFRGALLEQAAHVHLVRGETQAAHAVLASAVRASASIGRLLQLADVELVLGRHAEAGATMALLEQKLRARPLAMLGHRAQLERLRQRLEEGAATQTGDSQ